MGKRILCELLVAATILAVATTPLINPMIYSIHQTSDGENIIGSTGGFPTVGVYDFWPAKPVRDRTPPSPISDLAAGSPTNNSITLTWTASGDDGMDGNATGYIVKYSTAGAITANNWTHATTFNQSWKPAENCTAETHIVTGLTNGTKHWFAIEAYDEIPNFNGVSNSPSANTTANANTGIADATTLTIIVVVAVAGVALAVIAVVIMKMKTKHD